MSVIRGGPSGCGRTEVSLARSMVESFEPKRVRISQGRSLWPSMSGVRARTASTLALRAASSCAAYDDPAASRPAISPAIIPIRIRTPTRFFPARVGDPRQVRKGSGGFFAGRLVGDDGIAAGGDQGGGGRALGPMPAAAAKAIEIDVDHR